MAGTKLTTARIKTDFRKAYDANVVNASVNKIAMFTQARDLPAAIYPFLGQVPAMQKQTATGARGEENLPDYKIQVTNERYNVDIGESVDNVRRDEGNQFLGRVGEMGSSAAYFQASEVMKRLALGDTTTYGNAYDNNTFFHATRTLGKSGTINNMPTKTQVPGLQVTATANVTPEEAARQVMGLRAQMFSFKDDQGRPFNMGAQDLLYIVPNGQLYEAYSTAMFANNLAFSNASIAAVQGLKSQGVRFGLIEWPELTEALEVYCVRCDGLSARPVIVQEDLPVDVEYFGWGTEYTRLSRRVRALCDWVGGFGYGEFLHVVRGTIST